MGVEWPPTSNAGRAFFQIDSPLGTAIHNYWRSLSSNERFEYTEDMFAHKLYYNYSIRLRKISDSDRSIYWVVENEDSEEATMFKLEWE